MITTQIERNPCFVMASSLKGLIGDAVLALLTITGGAGVTGADEGILGVLAGYAVIT